MEYTGSGTLSVRTYTASGALPVKGSVVRITGVDENNRFVEYTLITDEDGVTTVIALPSPAKSYSMAPGALEVPYAIYDVEVSADGYYTKRIKNIAIFADTNSVQPINMIPISVSENGAEYPRGNLDATVRENENLEI